MKPLISRLSPQFIRRLINGALFYGVWFVCVANGANGKLLYIPAVLFTLIIHFLLSHQRILDLKILCLVVFLGFCVDTAYLQWGILSFTTPNPINPGIAPFWVVGIYALFATTITTALYWLEHRPWLAAILGSGGGAISYAYGEQMGAAQLLWGWIPTLALIGAVWFFLMPLFYWLIAKLKPPVATS